MRGRLSWRVCLVAETHLPNAAQHLMYFSSLTGDAIKGAFSIARKLVCNFTLNAACILSPASSGIFGPCEYSML